jgi:hypothetical protein
LKKKFPEAEITKIDTSRLIRIEKARLGYIPVVVEAAETDGAFKLLSINFEKKHFERVVYLIDEMFLVSPSLKRHFGDPYLEWDLGDSLIIVQGELINLVKK